MNKRDDKQTIREIQKYLRTISNSGKEIEKVKIDGIYGNRTRLAVRQFQRMFGIPVTGTVDEVTWNILLDEYYAALKYCKEPVNINCFGIEGGKDIRLGDNRNLIFIIQIMLDTFSIVCKDMIQKVTGIYDSQTEENIKTFQSVHGIEPTGVINLETWDALAEFYNQAEPRE